MANKKGFTIVEALIYVGILSILTLFFSVASNNSKEHQEPSYENTLPI